MDAPGSEPHCRNNKFRLWQVLLKAIDRQPYHFGYVFERIEQDGSGVHVYFANGRTERADLLVGCDGFRSSVRAHLVLPVVQSTKFEFLIDLKTAKRLGLSIPGTMLLKAARSVLGLAPEWGSVCPRSGCRL